MRFLIVEDDAVCSKMIRGLLEPYALCDIARNGKEAIDAFRCAVAKKMPYHLMLLDIMMPEMDGHETIKQIRKIEEFERGQIYPRGIKIIMTTALDDPDNVGHAFRCLCDAYLVKPIDEEALFSEIRTMYPCFALS
jgi:two-component system, chemotaxis family, chemotaxis protein CheY